MLHAPVQLISTLPPPREEAGQDSGTALSQKAKRARGRVSLAENCSPGGRGGLLEHGQSTVIGLERGWPETAAATGARGRPRRVRGGARPVGTRATRRQRSNR